MSIITVEPGLVRLSTGPGESLLEAIRRNGDLHFETPCNGNGSCGKCRVIVKKGNLSLPSDAEKNLLGEEELKKNVRLACFAKCVGSDDEIVISFPEKKGRDIVLGGLHLDGTVKEPLFPNSDYRRYAIAVDIGTTTVVCALIDTKKGTEAAEASAINPQTTIGGDVLSRIAYTINHKEGLSKLQSLILGCLNDLTLKLTEEASIQEDQIAGYAVAANCTMLHLLLGVDPSSLAAVPFTPVFTAGQHRSAKEAGLIHCGGEAELYCLPSVSAYIGADIVAGVHMCDLIHAKKNVMFIDIGTNGEMVFSKHGKMWGCSCAAGPAMEGMNITCGMRAAEGAIERVSFRNGAFDVKTIGGKKPEGICGSGVLETVASLLASGGVEPSGKLCGNNEELRPFYYQEGKSKGFVLYGKDPEIRFSQADVRQIQLAKGALLSGFLTLVKSAGLTLDEVDEVIIAGQFGSYLKEDTLIDIGILPGEMRGKVHYIGNTSLSGAASVLLDKALSDDYEKLAGKVTYTELGSEEGYAKLFMKCLNFPEES